MSVAFERMPDWSKWEGECADGEFLLERYLGDSNGSAVFFTRFGSERAAIKLVRASHAQAEDLVECWNRAAILSHPHLLRIFKTGTCLVKDLSLAYVVVEYADENLATVLAERTLDLDETLEMIQPVADVLAYLHARGLAHGNLKPSNIFAVEDAVKVACDTVSAGDPAVDMLALSKTMIQALTHWDGEIGPDRASVETLSQPFQEIVRNCFFAEPQSRWSSAEVAGLLRSGGRAVPINSVRGVQVSTNAARKGWFGFFAVLALILFSLTVGALVMRRKVVPATPRPTSQALAATAHSAAPDSVSAESSGLNAADSIPPVRETGPDRDIWSQQGIVHHVLPDIPLKARKTVRGKATVSVRVGVDSSGNVTDATLERGGSRYFGKLALTAAKQWQFASLSGAGRREWVLRFEITKTAVNVVPEARTVAK